MTIKPIHIIAIVGWLLAISVIFITLKSPTKTNYIQEEMDRVDALERKNKILFQEIDKLLIENDTLKHRKVKTEIIYKERIRNVYQIHDTDLVDSVHAILSRYVRPTE